MRRINIFLVTFLLVTVWLAVQPATADSLPTVILAGQHFTVSIANTPDELERGLMYRQELGPDQGMLFVFPDSAPRHFWMKHTLIPLDILFFDSNARLVSFTYKAQPCRADPCPVYASNAPAKYVLEIPAGTAARDSIRLGEIMTIRL